MLLSLETNSQDLPWWLFVGIDKFDCFDGIILSQTHHKVMLNFPACFLQGEIWNLLYLSSAILTRIWIPQR